MFFKSDRQQLIDEQLLKAIDKGSLELLDHWIDNGANLASLDNNCTPIEKAANQRKWDIVSRIAEREKDNGSYGYIYALNEAIIHHETNVAVDLIMANADLFEEVFHKKRWTVLHTAIYMGNAEIVELLLKAKPSLLTNEIRFIPLPLTLAAKMLCENADDAWRLAQNLEVLRILFRVAKAQMDKELFRINWMARYGFDDAFHFVAAVGNKEMINCFTSIGVPLNLRLENKSIVHFAAEHEYFEIAALTLYKHPELEHTKYYTGTEFNPKTPRDINEDFMNKTGTWARHMREYLYKSWLLLQSQSTKDSGFSCIPIDICAIFLLNLTHVISSELKLYMDEKAFPHIYSKKSIGYDMMRNIVVDSQKEEEKNWLMKWF